MFCSIGPRVQEAQTCLESALLRIKELEAAGGPRPPREREHPSGALVPASDTREQGEASAPSAQVESPTTLKLWILRSCGEWRSFESF